MIVALTKLCLRELYSAYVQEDLDKLCRRMYPERLCKAYWEALWLASDNPSQQKINPPLKDSYIDAVSAPRRGP